MRPGNVEVVGELGKSSHGEGTCVSDGGDTRVSDGGKRGWMMSGLCFCEIEADQVMRRPGFVTPASLLGDASEVPRDRML